MIIIFISPHKFKSSNLIKLFKSISYFFIKLIYLIYVVIFKHMSFFFEWGGN